MRKRRSFFSNTSYNKRMSRWLKTGIISVILLAIIYLAGPRVSFDPVTISQDMPAAENIAALDSIIAAEESRVSGLKDRNASVIVWANDSLKQRTPFVLLYLHGFSASYMEGDPIHAEFAKRYGMNMYVPRLEGHGLSTRESFKNLTPDAYVDSAVKAYGIARQLGEKVIIMSCSTGSTLDIILTASGFPVFGHIMLSPNIDLFDTKSEILLLPWGKAIAEQVLGGKYKINQYTDEAKKYWNPEYHYHGIFVVKWLLKNYMTDENFEKVKEPLYVGYYFKNEKEQDDVVSVEKMKYFLAKAGTEPSSKKEAVFPDAATHMIGSDLYCKSIPDIQKSVHQFAEEVLSLEPKI